MGADCSDRQVEIILSILKPGGRLWFVPDGDTAGDRFASAFVAQMLPLRFVRWVKLDKDKQPTDVPPERIKTILKV
jgi:hypothetical protein